MELSRPPLVVTFELSEKRKAIVADALAGASAVVYLTELDEAARAEASECTRHARPKPGVVHSAKSTIQSQLEAAVHPSDDIIHLLHTGLFRRRRVLPCEVLADELSASTSHSSHQPQLTVAQSLLSCLTTKEAQRLLVKFVHAFVDRRM
jgi:hypothetical protein